MNNHYPSRAAREITNEVGERVVKVDRCRVKKWLEVRRELEYSIGVWRWTLDRGEGEIMESNSRDGDWIPAVGTGLNLTVVSGRGSKVDHNGSSGQEDS